MATSTPRSDRPDLARVPLVSAVVADRRPLPALPRPAGPYRRAWWRFRRDRLAMGALALFALLAVVSFLGPLVIAIDPYQQDLRGSLLAPGDAGHVLGTDNFGRDVLLRLVDGGRVSMTVGLAAVSVSLAIGGLIGLFAGYFGGWTDRILMRIIDVKLAFPGILLALVIVTVLGSGLEKVMIAVGIGGIPRFARVVRGSVLNTKGELYVEAARSIGASDRRIMFVHLVPQVLGPVITIGTFGLATAILSTASLSFLGLGAQPPTAEWGLMLSEARRFIRIAWWLAVFPGVTVTSVVLAANLLGDAVRDALDPRLFSKAD
ncbi:MAG: ABC transporter permease [Chloroflexi bacterium]|nr:MAG: ABC transporter permease [Chloroflexota bacterium]